MAFLIGGANTTSTGAFEVTNSCRFGGDAYMNKTGSAGNQKTWTFSAWVKKSEPTTTTASGVNIFFGVGTGRLTCRFDPDVIQIYDYSSQYGITTTAKFRDVSAWYNIVFNWDTTQATAGNRIKLWVNGEQITSFSASSYPTEDYDSIVNSTVDHQIGGRDNLSSERFNGCMAEVCLIDGLALTASSFGEFNEDSPTIWQPIDVSGLTFGTNGFYCDFEASDNLGNDANGGTDLGETNIAATDQTVDTPTNNFTTLNNLVPFGTFTEGNTVWGSVASGDGCAFSTIGVAGGKWYAEVKCTGAQTSGFGVGVVPMQLMTGAAAGGGTATIGGVEYIDARVLSNGSNATGSITGISQNDIIGIALNMDDAEVKFYLNNTVQEGGTTISLPSGGFWCFSTSDYHSTNATEASMNFGNPAYSLTSAESDENGYGNFEFAPPSGYLALCSKNLATDG